MHNIAFLFTICLHLIAIFLSITKYKNLQIESISVLLVFFRFHHEQYNVDSTDTIWLCLDHDKLIFYNNRVYNRSHEYNGTIRCAAHLVVSEMRPPLSRTWIDTSGHVWSPWSYFIRSSFFVRGIVYPDTIMYNNSSFTAGWRVHVIQPDILNMLESLSFVV